MMKEEKAFSANVTRRKLMQGAAAVTVSAATAAAQSRMTQKSTRVPDIGPKLQALSCPGHLPKMKKDDSNVHRFIAAFLFLVTNRKLAVELGGVAGGHPNALSTDEIAKKIGFTSDEVRSIWCIAESHAPEFNVVAQAFYDLAVGSGYEPGQPGCPITAEVLTKIASLATS